MNLDNLIEKAIIDVKYYQDRLAEAEARLDAFYTARDCKGEMIYDCGMEHHNENTTK